MRRTRRRKIGLAGNTLSDSGYAHDARAFLHSLRELGRDVLVINPRDAVHCELSDRLLIVVRPFMGPMDPRYRIWRTTFETETIPTYWVTGLNRLDEVWVPSAFNIETFRRSGVRRPLIRIPPPIDLTDYLMIDRSAEREGEEFTFLAIGTWQARKGWDVLLRAYFLEFTAADDVRLVLRIRVADQQQRREATSEIASLGEASRGSGRSIPRVRPLFEELGRSDYLALFASADAFVLATHGEGWGIPYMEAMAAGLPTIGTQWGGNLDFMRDNNSFLIRSYLVEVPPEAVAAYHWFDGKRWAAPDVDHLRMQLRRVRSGGHEVRQVAQAGRETIRTEFAPEAALDIISSRLEQFDEERLR